MIAKTSSSQKKLDMYKKTSIIDGNELVFEKNEEYFNQPMSFNEGYQLSEGTKVNGTLFEISKNEHLDIQMCLSGVLSVRTCILLLLFHLNGFVFCSLDGQDILLSRLSNNRFAILAESRKEPRRRRNRKGFEEMDSPFSVNSCEAQSMTKESSLNKNSSQKSNGIGSIRGCNDGSEEPFTVSQGKTTTSQSEKQNSALYCIVSSKKSKKIRKRDSIKPSSPSPVVLENDKAINSGSPIQSLSESTVETKKRGVESDLKSFDESKKLPNMHEENNKASQGSLESQSLGPGNRDRKYNILYSRANDSQSCDADKGERTCMSQRDFLATANHSNFPPAIPSYSSCPEHQCKGNVKFSSKKMPDGVQKIQQNYSPGVTSRCCEDYQQSNQKPRSKLKNSFNPDSHTFNSSKNYMYNEINEYYKRYENACDSSHSFTAYDNEIEKFLYFRDRCAISQYVLFIYSHIGEIFYYHFHKVCDNHKKISYLIFFNSGFIKPNNELNLNFGKRRFKSLVIRRIFTGGYFDYYYRLKIKKETVDYLEPKKMFSEFSAERYENELGDNKNVSAPSKNFGINIKENYSDNTFSFFDFNFIGNFDEFLP